MSTIVICEQDHLMRNLLTEWLRGAGYCVRGAADHGSVAPVHADLVIVSVYMPKQTGACLIDEVRTRYPGTPVMAISAQFRADLSIAGTTAESLGVAQLMAKPLTRAALLGAVKSLLSSAD
jgi:DNA-binding response OmpR family regulator